MSQLLTQSTKDAILKLRSDQVKSYDGSEVSIEDMPYLGVHFLKERLSRNSRGEIEFRPDRYTLDNFKREYAETVSSMDALTPLQSSPTTPVPVQFLQFFLPGFTFYITKARKIDSLVGMSIYGNWATEQLVSPELELTSLAVPYGDYTNIPLASYNPNFNVFTVVRFEMGMMVGMLEEERAAQIKLNSAATKRAACAEALEITRNAVGFYGFNAGANRTFGYLNTPGLPPYVTVATGAGGFTEWSTKTFLEIEADLLTAINGLRNSSGERATPEDSKMILAVSTAVRDYLNRTSEFGTQASPAEWLRLTYPNITVQSAPELNGANGGANVFYLYSETIDDLSTDDRKVFEQGVSTKFMTVGVERLAKGYKEDYSNALGGVWCKRPWAVYRGSGI